MFEGVGGGAAVDYLPAPADRPPLCEPLRVPEAATAPVSPRVRALLDAIVELRDAGSSGSQADGEALLRAAEAVQGLALREVAAVDRTGRFTEAGCGSAGSWVQRVTGASRLTARATARLAGRLSSDLRPVGDLLTSGHITVAHARAVVYGVRGIDADVVQEVLPALCEAALLTDPVTLGARLRETAAAVSPELAKAASRRLEARCGFVLSELPDGSFATGGQLLPETGQLLRTALDALTGRRETGDTRTAPQRRDQALAQLARHCLDCPDSGLPDTPSGRAQVLVVATLDAMHSAAGKPYTGTDPGNDVGADACGRASVGAVGADRDDRDLHNGLAEADCGAYDPSDPSDATDATDAPDATEFAQPADPTDGTGPAARTRSTSWPQRSRAGSPRRVQAARSPRPATPARARCSHPSSCCD